MSDSSSEADVVEYDSNSGQETSDDSRSEVVEFSYDSDDDDESIKGNLDRTGGSFVVAGLCSNTPLPGLAVEHHGPVGLPLDVPTAKAIIGVCHQAKFGKGSETILDESVRKTWELDPDRFEFQNPEWEPDIQRVARNAATQLGYSAQASVEAQLYKLLLYEEGAMFKAHQDTEKAAGMFGTLVVSLPSQHEGGDIIASHQGQTKTCSTAAKSAYNQQYVAWYADVMHEVRPVTSGYRLVVVYNLLQTSPGPMPTAAKMFGAQNELRGVLDGWHRGIKKGNEDVPQYLIYGFDHEYTEASLCLHSLKNLDRMKTECLEEACSQSGVGCYLAICKKEESGSCEDHSNGKYHHLEDITDIDNGITRMVDLDGNILAKNLDLEEQACIQGDLFDGLTPKEDYTSYMGNWGPEATHVYHASVAILVPFASREAWLETDVGKRNVDINTWIQRLYNRLPQQENLPSTVREDLYELSRLASRYKKISGSRMPYLKPKYEFPAAEAAWPIKAALKLGSHDLFDQVLRAKLQIDDEKLVYVGQGLCQFRLNEEEVRSSVSFVLESRQTFQQKFQAIRYITHGYLKHLHRSSDSPIADYGKVPRFRELMVSYLYVELASGKLEVRDDGFALAEMTIVYDREDVLNKYLDNQMLNLGLILTIGRLLAAVQGGFNCLTPLTAFIVRLQSLNDRIQIPLEDAQPGLYSIVDTVCSSFLVQWHSKGTKRNRSGTETSTPECVSHPGDVATLLQHLSTPETRHLRAKLLARLSSSLDPAPTIAFPAFFMPLLAALIPHLQSHPQHIPEYAPLFQQTLRFYKNRYIQAAPPTSNWSFPSLGCKRCQDCQRLDAFLLDPSQRVLKIRAHKSTRAHLHQRLEYTGHKHETDRSTYPETLVVTKAKSEKMGVYEAWEKRVKEGEEVLKGMEKGVLEKLLGARWAERCDLRHWHWSGDEGGRRNGGGRRRGGVAEVIDLT
ncbi:MAG: hypothetical protein Q9195_006959 [Heterodermia aff. obscurata]